MLLVPEGRDGGLREPDVHGSAVKCCDANVYSFQVVITGEGREVQHVRDLR